MTKKFIICGAGGQGVVSIGILLANIFMMCDKYVTFSPCYGAEMRGGAVNCTVNMSDSPIYSFQTKYTDYLISFNQASYDKFISKVAKNGFVITNSSMVKIDNNRRKDVTYISVPFSQDASNMGNIKMANSIALGILIKILKDIPVDTVKLAYEKVAKNKKDMIAKNIEAFMFGYNIIKEGKYE